MKHMLFAVLILAFQSVSAQETEVKQAVVTFFEGFHGRDTIKMKSVFAKEMVLHSVSEKKEGAKLSVESASQLNKSIASIPKEVQFEEKLLSWKIEVDGAMAHVWTPYEFYINGKLSHTGVNSFQLFKSADGWKITYCIDTRRAP